MKKDNRCFQYATVASHYEEIGKNPERPTKNKLFINRCNFKEIDFSSETDDWKKIDKNNVTIALNVLYAKNENTYNAYVSKHNSNREKSVILLMFRNGEEWHYLAVKKNISYIKRNYV